MFDQNYVECLHQNYENLENIGYEMGMLGEVICRRFSQNQN